MRKDLKKLIKFLLIIIAILGIAFLVFMFWVAASITNPGRVSDLETEGSKIATLIDCKKMLKEENAWNPAVSYNYVYYLKEKHCPTPEKLENVEKVRNEFCDRVAKEDPKLHNFYVNNIHGAKLCPSDKSDNSPTQQNQDQ